MRVELVNGRYLLCGHTLSRNQVEVGQIWASADGSDRTVQVVAIKSDWVTYEWITNGKPARHEKDYFSFQCRYCLVLNEDKIPEHLK